MKSVSLHARQIVCLLAVIFPPGLFAAEKAAPVTEPSISAIDNRLQNIERMLQNQGLLDMLQQIERLQEEVTALRGQIEVNNHELERLRDRQRKLYNDLDQRLQQANTAERPAEEESPPLETIAPAEPESAAGEASTALTVETVNDGEQQDESQPTAEEEKRADSENATAGGEESAVEEEEAPPLETATAEDSPESTDAPDPLAAQTEYQEAFNLLRNAEYDRAITEFDKFLARHPDSQYSDNAQYWMGEAYYVTRRFNEAITEYMELVSNYPDSQKAPDGLLKIAYSYLEMGQKAEAEKAFRDLINKYPDSSAAADAEKRIQNASSS